LSLFRIVEVAEQIDQNFKLKKLQERNVKNRWNKNKDVEAFKLINELIKKTSLDYKILKLGKGKMHPELKNMLTIVKEQTDWRGSIYELRTRISVVLKDKKFTARDLRRAKREIKKFKKGKISEEKLSESFPGKSLAQILA
jgi:hypothetical protein